MVLEVFSALNDSLVADAKEKKMLGGMRVKEIGPSATLLTLALTL